MGEARRSRTRFSLTRARPSGPKLSRADARRAAVFSWTARVVVPLVGATMRVRASNEHRLAEYRRLGPGGLLFALWHGDYFPVFHYGRHQKICVIVSRSPDGEILARVLRAAGYRTVRGSNTRGATAAMVETARCVRAGHDAVIAVDGPRGPALRAKSGIVLLAKMTGCPVVPLAVGMSRCKQFASWDRFRLPLPFSRVLLAAGEPVTVPARAGDELLERRRLELERALLALSERTQAAAGGAEFRRARRPRGFASSFAPPRRASGAERPARAAQAGLVR